ncbi:MAG: YHYH protein [Flavobacteriales bacterium]|jgi:hypothetical protein
MNKVKLILTFLFIVFIVISNHLNAHDIHTGHAEGLPKIRLKDGEEFNGAFIFEKDNFWFFQTTDGTIKKLNPRLLNNEDYRLIKNKITRIEHLNHSVQLESKKLPKNKSVSSSLIPLVFFGLILGSILMSFIFWRIINITGIFAFSALLVASSFTNSTYKLFKGIEKTTSPLQIDSAFIPFKPQVNTFWDNNYFYVESHGIPTTHEMMVGISNHGWQQQVPIPQCYIGANSWPIPLNPQFAVNPIPIDSIHFTRGAIAIAVNGVPIFNYHTNTGVDSYLDGQLDAYGGHCGKADDYHYHIAPLHLYDHTVNTLPIAYALDGFPIYGNLEPNGASMQSLDVHHGHAWANGSYHYHGTSTAPYMINSFAGQVTEDATHQLIPQAQASPVRPSLTPLNGALITSCILNASQNGYSLSYSLNNQNYAVNYSWTPTGIYTFNFVSPNGTTTQTYNGFLPCEITANNHELNLSIHTSIYPNPSNSIISILIDPVFQSEIKEIQIIDIFGKELKHTHGFVPELMISDLNVGNYFVVFKMKNGLSQVRTFIKL